MLKKTMILLTLAAGASGCAAAPPPVDAAPEAAIRGAKEVGAESVPRASLFLKLSEEQSANAKVMAANGDTAGAELVSKRANADAELALSLTRKTAAEAEANALTAKLEALRGRK